MKKSTSQTQIALFPIVATGKRVNQEESDEKRVRLISGIVVRGHPHARKPTDKIAFLTIELLKSDQDSQTFAHSLEKALILKTKETWVVIRQNSIMKESCSYNTFSLTSLFSPINLLGCMTLENPSLPRSVDMELQILEMWESGMEWVIDRFVEGLLFSQIGNSRDEGYFACLRKMFMVVLAWRRNEPCSNYDIETFIQKTNECLLDNPIGFHFNNTLLDILEIYSKVMEKH